MGGEGGGHGSMWVVGAVGVVGAVWVVWGGVGGDYRTLDSLSAGGEKDMYADGAVGVLEERKVGAVGEVGTLLWVVNAVKAQNHTKQEGAPPSADPGGVGG